ncbi:cytochrome P450 2K1-like protein [Lates japonicus]|uniref:Cytochrome P450 2K1-like protein n=1 Tax=Lates japonicus TaxID=270547 RepID=A0AAD3MPB7_LATJO|nr:cytochrome P450 2K1-like protein [Lates japonicus]
MGILDLFLQTSSSVSLWGALVVLLLIYLVSTFSFNTQENRKDPPGPKPLPLLGNLLQLDLGRPYNTLLEFSKKGFVDAFLVHKKNLEESGITTSHFHNENLLKSVENLFVAGTETIAATMRWALLLMAKYPKIQDQVQEELSRVIGSRQVQVEDRKNLPFTNAVIHETQRLANVAPLGLPHKTTQDVTFQGHFIKKGTTVYPLLTSVLYDESEWERPHSFYPAHFLDKDGKFVKRDAFMPFSAGRRVCLGESLARMELFLFFTTLLQHFRFSPPPGVSADELDLTPRVGFTLNPSPHKLCAVSHMQPSNHPNHLIQLIKPVRVTALIAIALESQFGLGTHSLAEEKCYHM